MSYYEKTVGDRKNTDTKYGFSIQKYIRIEQVGYKSCDKHFFSLTCFIFSKRVFFF